MPNTHQWIISQIGSRQHFGVPRGFEAAGQLKRLYTDAWCPPWARRILRRGSGAARAFSTRWHAEIPREKVVHYNFHAVANGLRAVLHGRPTMEKQYLDFLRIGWHFDDCVASDLARAGQLNPATDAFFGFNTGCLKTLKTLRDRGVCTVLDQIDPAKVEEEIVAAEADAWPGWEQIAGRVPQAYWDHMAAEWAAATIVLVNSNWSRLALIKQGVPDEKICIIPVPYEPDVGPVPMPRRDGGPLTVLWLGSVILRKGIQYLVDAARQLQSTSLKFVIAGPIGISKKALDTAPPNMKFLGRITRDQTNLIYKSADIFVLPTISDGFAVTQIEAMNKGLPVVTTPNCGEVVTHGKDGLIVPARDATALANAILKLDQDRNLLAEMSHMAFLRSTQFLLPNQARLVEATIQKLKAETAKAAAQRGGDAKMR